MTASTNIRVPDKVTVSKKSQATMASAWERRKPAQVVAERPGAGSIPAAFKISHTVEGAVGLHHSAVASKLRLHGQLAAVMRPVHTR